jgi:hypothetical protein
MTDFCLLAPPPATCRSCTHWDPLFDDRTIATIGACMEELSDRLLADADHSCVAWTRMLRFPAGLPGVPDSPGG